MRICGIHRGKAPHLFPVFLVCGLLIVLGVTHPASVRAQQERAGLVSSSASARLPDPVVLAATLDPTSKRILVDFEHDDLSRWERASSREKSRATYEIVPVPGGGQALHAVIPDFADWDNTTLGFTQPFAGGQTLTCFRATGRAETRQLVVEWQEKDGSRWIATVDLTTQWKDYALPPGAFRPWMPPAGRGGPGDHLHVENAVRFQVGLALSHAELKPGFQEFWLDDLGTASALPEAVTANGIVNTVVDASTIRVSGVGNVRLIGVTALRDPGRKPQPNDDVFGVEADRATRRLAAGHRVRLEIEPSLRSGAGAALAWVFLEDGSLLNEQLIRRGYARLDALAKKTRYAARLQAAEEEARIARRGLWPKQTPGSNPPPKQSPPTKTTGKQP